MTENKTLKLARVLRGLVWFTFVCNLIALYILPVLVAENFHPAVAEPFLRDPVSMLTSMPALWIFLSASAPPVLALTLFLTICGVCTAVILWQAKRVLDTILKGEVFTVGNAKNMKRAAACCFLISGAALARLVWEFFYYDSIAPLFTYNALFVPIFLMAGLLCMVMSALFLQAAALKEENDLTI